MKKETYESPKKVFLRQSYMKMLQRNAGQNLAYIAW